jgi:hypothetical protein
VPRLLRIAIALLRPHPKKKDGITESPSDSPRMGLRPRYPCLVVYRRGALVETEAAG